MKKIFYGWRVVGAGGALQFLQSVLLNQAFGIYVAVLVEERGWSKTALSGAAALKSTEVALLGPDTRVAGGSVRIHGHGSPWRDSVWHRVHAVEPD